ncbi:immunity 22 family protein [Tenacibaculum tangerinum]|uniref:Immunity 22 family protein n=1 Tax=Tenacibaculum tangerinum TaxID=3038772 RepID=A0ABY8KZJ5_9FLAO|nr:immunity 22 family protein [Tenacibaculum tangerinum]WGH74647.1 immunity 22 family protein [Tenacibaculum tangerinum]
MEKQGKVSLWVGKFDSREVLDSFLNETYDEDGELSSDFMNEFEIDFIDNQFQEVYFYEGISDKKEIFDGFSYIDSFIKNIPDMNWAEKNTILLLYNFEYSKKIDDKKIEFIDCYDFIED